MTNDKLADEIERHEAKRYAGQVIPPYPLYEDEAALVITALRAERPQSGEMVMVPREPTEDEKRKIVASLLIQLWITLPQIPVGTMPNYEQAWDIAKSVLAAAEAERGKT